MTHLGQAELIIIVSPDGKLTVGSEALPRNQWVPRAQTSRGPRCAHRPGGRGANSTSTISTSTLVASCAVPDLTTPALVPRHVEIDGRRRHPSILTPSSLTTDSSEQPPASLASAVSRVAERRRRRRHQAPALVVRAYLDPGPAPSS